MKKYRLYYTNINSGREFFIDVDNNDEIQPALQKKPEYVREPDNWECGRAVIHLKIKRRWLNE